MSSPLRGSPAKSPKKSKSIRVVEDSEKIYLAQNEVQQQQFLVAERDVELERMKTTLEGLNKKLMVSEDYKSESVQYHTSFTTSEEVRAGTLQVHIENVATQVKVDTAQHSEKHNRDTKTIDELQATIRALEAKANETLKAHLDLMDRTKKEHEAEIDKLEREHHGEKVVHADEKDHQQKSWIQRTSVIETKGAVTLQDRDSNHNISLADLEKQKVQRERDHLDAVKRMNDQYERNLQQMQADHAAEMARLRDEMRRQNEKHDTELRAQNDAHLKAQKEQNEKHESELRTQNDHHLKAQKEQSDKHEAETRAANNKHETELRTQNDHHLKAQKEQNDRHADEKRAAAQKHDEELRAMDLKQKQQNDRHLQTQREQNDRHESELKRFRDEQEAQDAANRRAIERMRADHSRETSEKQVSHETQNNERESRFKEERTVATKNHEAKVLELSLALQTLRAVKDMEIKGLHESWNKERADLRLTIDQLKIKVSTLETSLLEKTSIIISLNETIERKIDVERQLSEAMQREDENRDAREKLRADLDAATDFIFVLEEKVYKANQTSLELLKQLKDAEVEIETLKQYIIDLKQRIAVYIPVKEDQIDKRLAEYINNYPERSKLKIMFMRESSGVYQFGTKRIMVKVERDNIKIRVGGGFMSIDTFLEQYTPQELEKLERKDPLKRMSEKIAVQSTIKTQIAREDSPVRKSMSPKKARPSTAV